MNSKLNLIADWTARAAVANYRIGTLAKSSGVCPRQLHRFFRDHTGMSPKAWLNDLRLAQARILLLRSGLNVSQVADQLGYKRVAHFSREFRKRFGITPSCFQRILRGASELDKRKSDLDKPMDFPFARNQRVMATAHSESESDAKT